MTTTSGSTGVGNPDMVLVGELMEEIERHPPAIGARKLLVEHYISVGWATAAMENAKELKKLAPKDSEVTKFLQVLEKKPEPPTPPALPVLAKKPVSVVSPPAAKTLQWDPKTGRYKKREARNKSEVPLAKLDNLETARQDLTAGYQAMQIKARYILADLVHLEASQKKAGFPQSRYTARVRTIAEGRGKPISRTGEPDSASAVARSIRNDPASATNLILKDLEYMKNWIREPHGKPSGASDDTVRDGLVKRRAALEAALPEELKVHCEHALMHVEHEHLSRNYANTETMYGDEVKAIPRVNFYVTEDNYAWDMEELVAAIKANNGVLRNPLSKQMFTPKDVKGIMMHPLGKPLAALAVKQREMAKGVRPDTIERMEQLSCVLLEDQSTDALPSRIAVDEFLAFIATLPELEQKAIEDLKCPAKDTHTGQPYDFSIGEAVRDAKGNQVCFHKTGDFIKQAAAHLRRNRGGADAASCAVM